MDLPASAAAVAALVACLSCSNPSGSSTAAPGPPAPAPLPAPGGCNNLMGVQATCSGFAVARQSSDPGAPGTVGFKVLVLVESSGSPLGAVELRYRVPADRAAEFERAYAAAAPQACVATIVRPPCDPSASDVQIPGLPPPPFAMREP